MRSIRLGGTSLCPALFPSALSSRPSSGDYFACPFHRNRLAPHGVSVRPYSASGATIYTAGDRYIPNSDTTQVSNLDAFVVTLLDTR